LNLSHAEELGEVFVLQLSKDPSLPQESLSKTRPRILASVVSLDLQSDDAAVGVAPRPVDLPHAAGPETVLNLVTGDLWNAHG
jgi:hypothetical protein